MDCTGLTTKVINRFKQGGDNSTKTIAKELGVTYYMTNKILNEHLNSKKVK
jgi:hypothetical protein